MMGPLSVGLTAEPSPNSELRPIPATLRTPVAPGAPVAPSAPVAPMHRPSRGACRSRSARPPAAPWVGRAPGSAAPCDPASSCAPPAHGTPGDPRDPRAGVAPCRPLSALDRLVAQDGRLQRAVVELSRADTVARRQPFGCGIRRPAQRDERQRRPGEAAEHSPEAAASKTSLRQSQTQSIPRSRGR